MRFASHQVNLMYFIMELESMGGNLGVLLVYVFPPKSFRSERWRDLMCIIYASLYIYTLLGGYYVKYIRIHNLHSRF